MDLSQFQSPRSAARSGRYLRFDIAYAEPLVPPLPVLRRPFICPDIMDLPV
ncbi:hypothetical protein N9A45_00465 [bacterium]|nr:hypothetical protein [bacterium]